MKNKENKIELMSPAGDFPSLVAACNAGADAVYFGINDFSMRQGKKNFKLGDLKKIRKICNSYKRKPKIYVTLNTLVYDSELKRLEAVIKKMKGKVDAVIVSDFAAINFCKKYKIPFFISTQMSVSNLMALEFYKKIGAKRVVLARELNLKQIKEIAKNKSIETEVFIHGAMCVAVSGRCFMSQFLFNRSANRGTCSHPCRREYIVKEKESNYELKIYNNKVMSAKDLCTLPLIEKIKKTGVSSLKIEGRNRDVRYVSITTKVYRKALDKKLSIEEIIESMKELESVFHRGFSSGFYLGKPLFTDFATVENSASSTYKEYIGKVVHFYPKMSVVLINLVKNLSVNDKLVFVSSKIGEKTVQVEKMEINKKERRRAKKGEDIGIKVSSFIPKNAEVYRLKKRKI